MRDRREVTLTIKKAANGYIVEAQGRKGEGPYVAPTRTDMLQVVDDLVARMEAGEPVGHDVSTPRYMVRGCKE
jgi:hypothetical protein